MLSIIGMGYTKLVWGYDSTLSMSPLVDLVLLILCV